MENGIRTYKTGKVIKIDKAVVDEAIERVARNYDLSGADKDYELTHAPHLGVGSSTQYFGLIDIDNRRIHLPQISHESHVLHEATHWILACNNYKFRDISSDLLYPRLVEETLTELTVADFLGYEFPSSIDEIGDYRTMSRERIKRRLNSRNPAERFAFKHRRLEDLSLGIGNDSKIIGLEESMEIDLSFMKSLGIDRAKSYAFEIVRLLSKSNASMLYNREVSSTGVFRRGLSRLNEMTAKNFYFSSVVPLMRRMANSPKS